MRLGSIQLASGLIFLFWGGDRVRKNTLRPSSFLDKSLLWTRLGIAYKLNLVTRESEYQSGLKCHLFCGCFTDYENTFEVVGEPDCTVDLASDADLGVPLSKDWFEWADETKLEPVLSSAFTQNLHSELPLSRRCR
jgi:hypothetical protein